MQFTTDHEAHIPALVTLFRDTFAASEGTAEGAAIGSLAHDLLTTTPQRDLFVCVAREKARPASGSRSELTDEIGALIFSRLSYCNDPRSVFVLGPVAVLPTHQRRGTGQLLLRFGHDTLRKAGVDVVLTYGDPAYYSRAGYHPINQDDIPAPYRLQFPEGWLGQSLSAAPLGSIVGPVQCVPAFADPAYW